MLKNKSKEAYLVPAPKARLCRKVLVAKCLPGCAEGPYQGQPLPLENALKTYLVPGWKARLSRRPRGYPGGRSRAKTSVRPSKSLKNKHFGADIHDPKARTSMTPGNFGQKNFGLNFRSLMKLRMLETYAYSIVPCFHTCSCNALGRQHGQSFPPGGVQQLMQTCHCSSSSNSCMFGLTPALASNKQCLALRGQKSFENPKPDNRWREPEVLGCFFGFGPANVFVVGKLPANFSANFGEFFRKFFSLVFPGFSPPPHPPKEIHAQNSSPELSAFLSDFTFLNPIFCSHRFSAYRGVQQIEKVNEHTDSGKYAHV